MKKIKIYLQSPWKWTDSPYYKYLRNEHPVGIEYVNAGEFKLIQNGGELKIRNWVKKSARKIIKKIYPAMPNVHWTSYARNYDLIHCAHCLSSNKQPWVCDIEYVGQFWAAPIRHNVYSSKAKIRKYLQSEYCKKILSVDRMVKKWNCKGISRN